MKICYINNLYGEQARGGAERVVSQTAAGLARRGRAVTVVSLGRPSAVTGAVCRRDGPCGPLGTGAGEPEERLLEVPQIFPYADLARHGLAARFFWHLLDLFNWPAAKALRGVLAQIAPAVVHTHNLMGWGFLVPGMLRRAGHRHLHTVHDVQLLHPSGLLPPGWTRPGWAQAAYVALLSRLMGSPAVVFFPSEFLRRLHDRFGFFQRSKKIVLRNPAPPVGAGRERPSLPRFLFAGQLEAHKGVTDLLAAWAVAQPAGGELSVAGSGSMEKSAAGARGVRSLGRLSPEAVRAQLQSATALIFPSIVIENAPTVILEALAVGTPVLASATGGVPELVRDGENGLLFPPADVPALSAVIARASAWTATEWRRLSDNARQAAGEWGLEKHLDVLEQEYVDSGKDPRA